MKKLLFLLSISLIAINCSQSLVEPYEDGTFYDSSLAAIYNIQNTDTTTLNVSILSNGNTSSGKVYLKNWNGSNESVILNRNVSYTFVFELSENLLPNSYNDTYSTNITKFSSYSTATNVNIIVNKECFQK